jgi:hypothetical protein
MFTMFRDLVVLQWRSESFILLIETTEQSAENPTALQLVKKFPAFYGTRRFVTTLTTARHLSIA